MILPNFKRLLHRDQSSNQGINLKLRDKSEYIWAIPRLREKNGKFEIRDWRPKFLLISLEILLSIWGKKININISKNVHVMCC
jgi:hypothetical protein